MLSLQVAYIEVKCSRCEESLVIEDTYGGKIPDLERKMKELRHNHKNCTNERRPHKETSRVR